MSWKLPPPCFEYLRTEFIEAKDGKCVCRFHPVEEMENPYGIIQGGVIAGFMDNLVGPAVMSVNPTRQSSTINLSVNFLRAVRAGEALLGTAEVIKYGRTQAYVEARLERESDNVLLVRATATNVFLEPKV